MYVDENRKNVQFKETPLTVSSEYKASFRKGEIAYKVKGGVQLDARGLFESAS